ncbi:MAG: glyoxalase superfamily protein [Pseudomonadota bacterium]
MPSFTVSVPIFRSFDEAKAREFYLDFLGFTVGFEHRFTPDAPLYMEVRLGDCVLHLSEHYGDATPGSAVRVETVDLAGYHRSLIAKAYKYARPGLHDQSWGWREMIVADPFQNRLVFCEPLPTA